jgi:hypothetical protein
MNKELFDRVKRGLNSGRSTDEVHADLASQGYLEDDVLEAISDIKGSSASEDDKRNSKIFTAKEVFDRIGYGFASTQFINILFYLIGANYFLVGTINGLKAVISILISSFMQEYAKVKRVSINFLSKSGILFGLSFLFIGMAITIKSLPLFSVALLVGAVGVVTYGDLYERLVEEQLKKERLGSFLKNISHFGVILTGISMIMSGILFDMFPILGSHNVTMFGRTLPMMGFLICFEITAISLIISGYILHFIKQKAAPEKTHEGFVRDYFARIRQQYKVFFSSPRIVLLLMASAVTGFVQILGNSYYGIFIYQQFADGKFVGLLPGVFTNIAFIFLFAIAVSFIGPQFSNYLNKRVGLAPSLVFGSLLISLMPLICVYNPNFMPIMVANALGVVGSALVGMGQGLLVRKILRDEQRSMYYAVLGIGIVLPFLFMIPAGAWTAQNYGLELLFQGLAGVMLFVAAPIYFLLVLVSSKDRL